MDVSKRLRDLREQCGFTQNGLAEYSVVSQSHLRRVELGQADITVSHLQFLCDAMNISLSKFFAETTEEDELSIAISKLSPKQKKLLLDFLNSL
jgi:transcriptional regulator with XRE-family HTH domain